ncbi:MAG: ABC transporter substrate-binding protein, partial [Proteobacteria bacterium]|nr:ABC transporter substrate-binding protein [Pseudomonadota bacterium]
MRKLLTIAVAALVLPLIFGASTVTAQDKMRLPFAYIFSGPFIEFGERVWNEGLIPGLEVVNKAGGIRGKQVEFYKVDVRFPETSSWIIEFRRLCKDPAVPVIFGVGATKSTIAIFEDSRTCGTPVLSPSSGGAWPYRTADGKKDYGCCMFRYQPVPDEVMPVLIKTAVSRLK